MTVIVNIISQTCTVHASDSFITVPGPAGIRRIEEDKATKIVLVPQWAAAISYYGLATQDTGWHTLNWLQGRAREASRFCSAEAFARNLANELSEALSRLAFSRPEEAGIGLHFTTYELVEGYRVPELFTITNFADEQYRDVSAKVTCKRQTFDSLKLQRQANGNRDTSERLAVREFLGTGAWLVYNNGDWRMFNPAAGAIFNMLQIAAAEHRLRDPLQPRELRLLAKLAIRLVADLQTCAFAEGKRFVGGKLHNLSITPDGTVGSDTGDARLADRGAIDFAKRQSSR